MVWNVQGPGNNRKISAIKEVVRTYKPTVLALVETHMGDDHATKLEDILVYKGQSRVSAIGFSGGMWVYWNLEVVYVTPVTHHQQYITLEVARQGELPWFFSAVYASPDPTNRRVLWSELEEFARANNRPWLLTRDFNETRSLSERHGGDYNMARRCAIFINWIENCELIKLAFLGSAHTWARGNSVEIRQSARLDRALCNGDWGSLFEDAMEFVDQNWPSSGEFPVRLDGLSEKLQSWNSEIFGNIYKRKKSLIARIGGYQKELSIARRTNYIKLEAKLRKELDEVLAQEEILWYQKSRLKFIKDGDRNTSYFHVTTLVRRWRNKISTLKDDSEQCQDDPSRVKQIVVEYYKTLYTDEHNSGFNNAIPWDIFQDFNNEDWEWLTRPYSITEIERVISNMGSFKAPGPDGFQDLFYQKHWPLIEQSLSEMVLKALEDDMVLFGEATEEQAAVMKHVLDNFCMASGEKISNAKSRVFFSNNTEQTSIEEVCAALGFEETDDLGTYLGMPTINGRVTRQTFSHLEEKINRRLAGWSTKIFSRAGRTTLVQSTLTTIANYSMQTAKIRRTVCDSIDRKARRFLWGVDELKKLIHLISWENLQKPKSLGGLGLPSARQSNAAFLTKLGWRVLVEPTSLWSRVLRAKYCNNRCDIDIFQAKRSMSNVWAGISSPARNIVRGTTTVVGNGRRTLFWDHAWVDGICPSDHALARIPEAILGNTVSEMWSESSGWNWDCFANFLPQEILQKIASISLTEDPEMEDSLYWNGTSSGKFSLKSALVFLRGHDTSSEPESIMWRTIWRIPVQQRVRMFIWLAAHGRVMVNVNRVIRNMGDDPRCPRCEGDEETTEHLLRSCPVSKQIWNLIGIDSSNIYFFNSPFSEWLTRCASNDVSTNEANWPMMFAITCWWIWRWRNNVVFGRENKNPTEPRQFLTHQFEMSKKAFDRYDLFIPQPRPANIEVFIRWVPPPHTWVMLNTDGASMGNTGPAGGGGIFRDETGNFLHANYFSCGSCS
ncbi:uncharacterized protein LOC141629436 [Silene latifolia]|uniref:uncharacterized protein LOC141629436 n=1 Tax=Silene latifolia TaxID=37657 RepID=UPI003D7751AF